MVDDLVGVKTYDRDEDNGDADSGVNGECRSRLSNPPLLLLETLPPSQYRVAPTCSDVAGGGLPQICCSPSDRSVIQLLVVATASAGRRSRFRGMDRGDEDVVCGGNGGRLRDEKTVCSMSD